MALLRAFFRLEAAGGLLLLAATLVALAWANSPLRDSYAATFHAALGAHGWSLQRFTNDVLMALFFVVAGADIKQELVRGELRTPGRAALPLVAALGGMLVPAGIYLALNPGGPERAGWGIPVATDIAFALGCLSLVKRRVPPSLFVFLTALAIFDDLGAIVVVALFYGGGAHPGPILGFALGLALPAVQPTGAVPSPLEAALRSLRGAVAFGIVPVFALANAGVELGETAGFGSSVTLGVLLGLALGKPIGVGLATLGAVRLGLAPKPSGATSLQILGVCCLAGIGFTMSLLIGNLAFGGGALESEAKLGVLSASLASCVLGLGVLRLARRDAT